MRIHFTGACGRVIGALALELKQGRAWTVSASDDCQYGPMDRLLREGGLEISPTYEASQVPTNADALVTGVSVSPDNVEVATAKALGIPIYNMAQFLNRYLLKRGKRIVVTGTNGKTTVTAMLAWLLSHAGIQPDYLIGGTSPLFPNSVRFRNSKWTVMEGDEYIAGDDDHQPKFLYYKPDIVVLTNLSYDHAEVFNDLNLITRHFDKLVSILPEDGRLIIPSDDDRLRDVASHTCAKVVTIGKSRQSDYKITRVRPYSQGMAFNLNGQDIHIPLLGMMNVMNAALALAAAGEANVSLKQSAVALKEFRNASGRLEILENNATGTFVLDEGYHPAALGENIAALRLRFPKRHVTVALLPRFTGGNKGFQMDELPEVLAAADRVILAGVFDPTEFPSGPFSNRKLAARLKRRGTTTHVLKRISYLPRFLRKNWLDKGIVLCSLPPGHNFVYEPLIEWMRTKAGKRG